MHQTILPKRTQYIKIAQLLHQTILKYNAINTQTSQTKIHNWMYFHN